MNAGKPRLVPPYPVLLLACILGSAPFLAGSATADDTNEPVYLRNNATVQADRQALLREEFRERREEVREFLERAKKARKGRGQKAVPSVPNPDYAGAAEAARVAREYGLNQITVAPSNTKANDKTADGAGAGQAEQHLAFLGLNGLCAWNDGQGFTTGPDVQGYGWTVDGGATWTDGGVPLKGGTITVWTSDPSVTVNEKTGDFYYCGLTTNSGTNNNGVGVARGHFQAGTYVWDAATVVSSGPSSSQGFDKQWIAADSLTGNLYVTWTKFVVGGDHVWFARSTDNGATWSAPLQMSGSWENGLVSGSRPAVGPNGEVYVVYSAIGAVDADSIKVRKSTDGGVTFGPSVVGMTVYDNYFTGAPGFNRGRAVTFPSVAVDRSTGPQRGRVYLSIQDAVNFYNDPIGGGTSKSEVENNGNFANATPFTIGQTLRGAIATGEIDNWKFPATQGTTYIFFADSVRATTFKYTMRIYCPLDTTVVSRLALSSDGSASSATNVHALIVWTAPTTDTYYFRMQSSTSTGGYRIRTGFHTPSGSDVARDARDVTVASSLDGVTGWSNRKVVNDDLPYYDNWLPEIAVPCDGGAYAMWFDWRDTPASCFGGSNIYVTRSLNGGGTWAANQVATTAATANWTQVLSNIAPNQGDYNGIYGGDALAMAWADGRLGDSDVFTARVTTGYTLSGCPSDQPILAGNTLNTSVTVNNLNQMFSNTYNYNITVDRNWPGFPTGGSANAPSSGSTGAPISISVPDTAAHGEVVHVCVEISQNGACVQNCCFNLMVSNPATATLASLASASAEPGRVSLRWLVQTPGDITVYRTLDGSSWTSLGGAVADGTGYVSFVDTDVAAGVRYGYRLGITSQGGQVFAGQTWIEVPASAQFGLHQIFPNPARSGFSVSFSLATRAAATIEVFDVGGRRVASAALGELGAGRHTLALDPQTRHLPAGVYTVRLTQGAQSAQSRVSVVR